MYKSPVVRTRRSLAIQASSVEKEFTPVRVTKQQNLPTPKPPVDFETPKSRINPVMARIQRDFNSPSAAARVRANKAMKSPKFKKAAYEQFDVQHEEQDIITEEERNATIKPKSISEIFRNCKVYVEVRTGDDNRSAGIKNRLLRDGITVNEKLYKDTTHVIFKDGLLGTFKTAAKLGIPVTTILWLDACNVQKRLVECEKFPISNLDRYERPELYKRLRREKSMQPDLTRSAGKQYKHLVDRSFSQDDTRDDPKKHDTILENEGMELTLQGNQTTEMDVEAIDNDLEKWKENIRRFTTFTPNPMDQTARRKTLFTPQPISSSETDFSTPETNSGKTVIFNSSNRIGVSSRHSVFEISMNMFELNCKAMSQKNKADSPVSVEKIEPVKADVVRTQEVKTGVIRKRKLFNPDNEDLENEQKENLDKNSQGSQKKTKLNKTVGQVAEGWRTPVKTAVSTKPKKETVRRRETIACFKPKETTVKVKTPAKVRASPTKYIVCTNMSSNDKQVINAAILKLGGKVESEVSSKTTHVITPNADRTMNVLRGVIRACIILNVSWIHESIAKDKWADTTLYTHSICDSNRVHERSILGSRIYTNTAFSHRGAITNFYIVRDSIQTSRKIDYLKEIIVLCNGKVTEKLSEADIIISEEKFNTSKTVVIPSFVFDSAMKGTFVETANYRP